MLISYSYKSSIPCGFSCSQCLPNLLSPHLVEVLRTHWPILLPLALGTVLVLLVYLLPFSQPRNYEL